MDFISVKEFGRFYIPVRTYINPESSVLAATGSGYPIIGDISSLIIQNTLDTLKIVHFAPLMKLVFIKAEDVDI